MTLLLNNGTSRFRDNIGLYYYQIQKWALRTFMSVHHALHHALHWVGSIFCCCVRKIWKFYEELLFYLRARSLIRRANNSTQCTTTTTTNFSSWASPPHRFLPYSLPNSLPNLLPNLLPVTESREFIITDVTTHQEEWEAVRLKVYVTFPGNYFHLVRLQRVISPRLAEEYQVRRLALTAKGNVNEVLLWHGTSANHPLLVAMNGLDIKKCISGIYGSPDLGYSTSYSHNMNPSSTHKGELISDYNGGIRAVLLCKFLLGEDLVDSWKSGINFYVKRNDQVLCQYIVYVGTSPSLAKTWNS
jgi:hypothetical protein